MSTGSGSPYQAAEDERLLEQYEPETPFLHTPFETEGWLEQEAAGSVAVIERERASVLVETPFLTEYMGESPANLEAQQLEQTLMELFDRDFNEAVANLAMEAAAQAEAFGGPEHEVQTEQLLMEWLEPVRTATERAISDASEAAIDRQLDTMSEDEFEAFFDSFEPAPGSVAPEFEDFFKKVWNKVKKVARTAVNLAKKGVSAIAKLTPIGILLRKVGSLVRPLLNRVIRFAIKRLPASLQPIATTLGRRLGVLRESELEESELLTESPTTLELEGVALEFDVAVTTMLFASDEAESELFLAEATQETEAAAWASPVTELDVARERFVAQFAQLQQNENPTPVVEQFIPAVLPVLRIALRVVGRQRVVNFLAKLLARLIQPYVGPQAAVTLSRALVDVGLRMITLEAESEAPSQTAARAVAATLEDTVRRVTEFGLEQFDNLDEQPEQQRLLEAVATEAFFESAIAHFPAQLLDTRRLEDREMFLEAATQPGVWVMRPRPRYKKYTRVYDVKVTPQVAAQIQSFGGQALDAVLRARGVRFPVVARVHLYEAIPGTTLSHISALERSVAGLGSGAERAWSQIHPLTTRAAGLLLREPALGKDMDARWLQTRHRVGVGQRFYYLELPGGGPGTIIVPGRASEVNVTIDLPASQVRVSVYYSEADAQRVVAAGPSAGATAGARLATGMAAGVLTSIATGPTRHVTFVREATGELEGEEFWQRVAGEAAKRAVQWLLQELAKALMQMLRAALVRYFTARLAEFATATRNPASGVTLVLTFNHPGLRVLHVALAGRMPNMADVRAAARAIQLPSVTVVPGFTRR